MLTLIIVDASDVRNMLKINCQLRREHERHRSEILHKAAERKYVSFIALGVCKKYNRIFKRKGNHRGTASEYVEKLVRTMGIRNRAVNVVKAQLLVKCGMQQLPTKAQGNQSPVCFNSASWSSRRTRYR